jgi:hypothetical protein
MSSSGGPPLVIIASPVEHPHDDTLTGGLSWNVTAVMDMCLVLWGKKKGRRSLFLLIQCNQEMVAPRRVFFFFWIHELFFTTICCVGSYPFDW